MSLRKRIETGFTLVELLVVIGIIALLIAILMPALSRARKQALQASCGSNERQVTYAALAYANDWQEELPTRIGRDTLISGPVFPGDLHVYARLPVIGFDTVTIWDWGTYCWYYGCGSNVALGGWAFMMRDYLKNDFDIYVCPDGFYKKNDLLARWDGTISGMGPIPWPVASPEGGGWDEGKGLLFYKSGYLWLPHRPVGLATAATPCAGTSVPTTDRPNEIAKTASDKPDLLVLADFNLYTGHHFGGCGVSANNAECGLAANHNATSYKQLPGSMSACTPQVFPPDIGRRENPESMPLGMNRARIDARVTWLPWQDWRYFQWSSYDGPSYSYSWHSF